MLVILLTIYRRDSNKVLETKYENQLNKVTWEDTEILNYPGNRALFIPCH